MLRCTCISCELQKNPIGIDEAYPRFRWKLESDREQVWQTAYEIRVDGMWSSGKVDSHENLDIIYQGAPLQPFTQYQYAIRVWDNYGEISDWCAGNFETGLMNPHNWDAQWITTGEGNVEILPVFKKEFSIKDTPKCARIYATALGIYEITLNGHRVGDSWLAPGFTSYHKQLLYQTYDVTSLLQHENRLCVTLGKGWCRGRLAWKDKKNLFHCEPGILLQMRIEGPDGAIQTIGTDDTWMFADSPYRMAEIYDGEIYDASIASGGLYHWRPVCMLDYPLGHISAQPHEPVRITETVKPISLIQTPKGETVIDFGQNMVGWAEFRVHGLRGDHVRLSFAEVLDKEGNFYTENYRTAQSHVDYILSGIGEECYHPHFSFMGFRYVRVDSFPCEITLDCFTGLVIHSDFNRIGMFQCSNEEINRLYQNVIWGQRGNFVDVPTDCPQRDERLGWTGDAQVFIKAAALNYQVDAFFEKWLTDLRLDQSAEHGVPTVVPNVLDEYSCSAWSDAATICPWEIYLAYGDKRLLERQYESMKGYVEYIRSQGDNEYLWNTGFQYGDWLALDAGEGVFGRTATDFISTIFYAHSTHLVAKAAGVLGKEQDVRIYQQLFERIYQAFNQEFVTPNGRLTEDTQTAYVLALHFHMLENKERAVRRLVQLIEENGNRLTTGFVGTPYLCHVLVENGHPALAYSLVLQTEFPSWLYSVRQGATTTWEHWDGIKPDGSFWNSEMNSFNHYAYGCIVDWLYTKSAGIQYDESEPGYRKIIFKPMPDPRFSFVKAQVDTPCGIVKMFWEYKEGQVHYQVEIPPNAEAVFVWPDGNKKKLQSGKYKL